VAGSRVLAERRLVRGAREVDLASIAAAGASWQAQVHRYLAMPPG
jgi:hypothetical protein